MAQIDPRESTTPPGEQTRHGVARNMLGYSSEADSWLTGAIDVHVHGYPEMSLAFKSRQSDLQTIRMAQEFGVGGWVLKSHLWPTMDRVHHLTEQLGGDSDFALFSSICLNPILGGVNPFVVEAAAAHGAKVVFMPTWGSCHDNKPDGLISSIIGQYAPHVKEYVDATAASIIDENGSLLACARDVVRVCRELDLVLCTGHISIEESLALAKDSADEGFPRLLITHPLGYVEDPKELLPFAELGAICEFPNAGTLNPLYSKSVRGIDTAIAVLGPENCILSTDVFSPWVPPQPECLRMGVQQLAFLGWSRDEVRRLINDNPRRVLGLAVA